MNDFEVKEELLKQAEELAQNPEAADALSKASLLRKKWRRVSSSEEESLYDKEAADRFYSALDVINAKENEILSSVEDRKNAVIAKAKEVLEMKNFKQATKSMEDLMDEWKSAGVLPKEKNDELWGMFKAVRDEFFANRKQYYATLTETFAANKIEKEKLIEGAKEANKLENFKEIANIMNDLMEQWKKTGSAGRDNDDNLWAAFREERQAFFKNRNAYYDNLKSTYNQRVDAKKELIATAKKCLALSEFTDEEVGTVKGLRNSWKEIGFAGKDNEDALWNEFNTVLNKYFENMRYYK